MSRWIEWTYRGTALLVAVLALQGCGDTVGPLEGIAGRYSLIRFGNAALPIVSHIELRESPGIVCVDSLYSLVLVLRSNKTSAFETGRTTACNGAAPQPSGSTQPGTWTARNDSVFIHYTISSPAGPFSADVAAAIEGETLVIRTPIFIESDPTGSGGTTFDQVYRRE